MFVAHDAHPHVFQLSLTCEDSCPEFNRWRRLRKSGITLDFQRILRSGFGLVPLQSRLLDVEGFEKVSEMRRSDRVLSQLYLRRIDGVQTVVKSIVLPELLSRRDLEIELENLLNLRHPMIAPLLGFVFPVVSNDRLEMKILRLYLPEGSLADVLSKGRSWWTPTAKAKAIAGIALGLRFSHGLGLLHGSVKASNILFDSDQRIQLADFSQMRLSTGEVEPFSSEGWSPKADVLAFVSLLSEITISSSGAGSIGSPPCSVPDFVLEIINDGRSCDSADCLSFVDIVNRLKANAFQIIAGVDSDEVSAFVAEVEFAEQGRAME
jgi:serine/threonine protein kinase